MGFQQASPCADPAASVHAPNTTPLTIVTVLFFMWGLLTALNDVLIPHLKAIYTLSYVQAMLIQFCFFGAYFIVSLPAGMLIRKIGYQKGAVTGLLMAAAGCALFYPAAQSGYALFLLAFFVLASGITVLQVAANPYVTALGDPRTASSRLTLTQAFNSLGTALAPTLGGLLILSTAILSTEELAKLSENGQVAYRLTQASSVQGPYLALALALLLLSVLFAFARLPRIANPAMDEVATPVANPTRGTALSHTNLLLGVVAIFLYVGAEVSIGSFLINFMGEPSTGGISASDAAHYVSYYWGGAMVGRFIGVPVMRVISPGKVLTFNAILSMGLILIAVFGSGAFAMWSLLAVGLCNSIMFPTIFSMALHNLGRFRGQASGMLCMAIVGGALVPFVQGVVADTAGLQTSFLVPAACYVFIAYFGLKFASLFRPGNAPSI